MRDAVKKILLVLVLFALFAGLLNAGKAKDSDLFEKAGELSYEGQIDKARKMMEEPETDAPKAKADDSWEGTSMMLSMIWGAIGTGFFIYGKKQSKALYLICGIGLIVGPYFISNVLANAILGTLMTIVPFKIDL